MSSTLQPWVKRYQGLETFEKREYQRLMLFSGLMLLGYVFLLWKVHSINMHNLVVINLVTIPVFLYASFLVAQIRFKQAVLVFTLSNLIVVVFHTSAFGTHSGFHMLIWPIACLFAMNTNVGMATTRNVFGLAILIFICLQFFIPSRTDTPFYEYSMLVFLAVGGCLVSWLMTSMGTSVSKKRRKLERLANRDNLTDLYNRRFFTTFLNYQLAVSLREKRSFTLAMADIDHFKSINDEHGHDVGDKVLTSVADCFRTFLAQNDAACRWGGEEFLIYLPESKVEHAERVVQAVASVVSDNEIEGIKVTMSFGLVESDGNESLDEVLQRVDALMYQAKSQGRDNIQTKLL